ncbi:MAG: transporter substrate-binding domain-containing protein [Desulfobulbaceae bacterium]|nr:transporter substrate-binding domain-containing protein [Desulfobulbaceae bacterium]
MSEKKPQSTVFALIFTFFFIIVGFVTASTQATELGLTNEEKSWIAEHHTITVGGEKDWAPFDFVDEQGNYTGIAKAYLDILSEKTGLRIKMEIDDWENLLAKIKSGQIDLLPAIYYSENRESFVNFTESYSKHAEFIFVKEGREHYRSLDELHGEKVVVVKGYTIESFLEERHPEIALTKEPSILKALNALLTGKADAFINDIASTSYIARKYNIIGFEPTVLLEERINDLHMATSKEAEPLSRIINKVFRNIEAETHHRIQARWITLAPGKTKLPQLILTPKEKTWLEAHPIIHCTSDPSWMPYEGSDESGNFIGIFSDITGLISKRLGITIEYIPSESWDDVIYKVQHQKVDFFTSIPTEKRKEFLLFTPPIIIKELALLTRKSHPIISSFNTLKKNKVALISGYGYNEEVLNKYPNHEYVYVDSLKEGLHGLSSNKYDIFISNITSSLYYISKEMLNDLQVAGILDISFEVAYGVRNDWEIFHGILAKTLGSITDAERQEILNRWVKVDVVQRIDYSLLYKIGGIFALIVLIILYWNKRLHREIERREIVEAELQKSNEEIQTILDTAQNLIIVTNTRQLLNANQAFLDFFGYETLEAFFKKYRSICNFFIRHNDYFHLGKIDDPNLWISTLRKLSETKQIVSMQGKHTSFPSVFSVRISQLKESNVFVLAFTDITGIKMESKEHEYRSTHDPLTDLYNRLYINRFLMHELLKFKEVNEPVSVIILDIDFFKQVNDTYGHAAGDEVLKDLSKLLNVTIRSNDKVARWGGEEFLIVLVGTNLHQAQNLAEKLRKKIAGYLFKEPQKISCSFGVVSAKEEDTIKSLVERSDDALYRAKENGRNRVEVIG